MIDTFNNRSRIIKIIILSVGLIFVVRLAILQLFSTEYKELADGQALRDVTIFPSRGLIYDRNGKLLVYNEVVYDLNVVPKFVKGIDTALFCKTVGITRQEFDERMKKAEAHSYRAPSSFMKQISKEEYGSWSNQLYKFNGFEIVKRTIRVYKNPIGAHVLGYVGEVNNNRIEQDPYYKLGDYCGQSGLELSYENELRGKKGRMVMQVDVNGRNIGHYKDGALDSIPVEGANLYTTIDADLQSYAEKLMANKRGCVVAIEPSTGEVLALVSAPVYDPNLLVGRVRGENYSKLQSDISKPLYNRALQAQYPPGSIFKVAQAMTALDLGVITPQTGFPCDKVLVGCHNHPSARTVQEALKMSCNPYFYYTYKRIIQQDHYKSIYADSRYGLTIWCDYMARFGFGQRLDIDLPNVSSGRIPDTAFYDRIYGRNRWAFSTIYSNSIGQGEVEVVPLQMANLAAIVANRGYYYTPHLVRYIGKDSARIAKYQVKHSTGIDSVYFNIAAAGMYDVVHGAGGTGHRAAVPGIDVCGKTGTAQNSGNDHSVFISFAPLHNPKIAMAVYVENAKGGGGLWAAPISGLIIEKYLKGTVKRTETEEMYMNINPCHSLPTASNQKSKQKHK